MAHSSVSNTVIEAGQIQLTNAVKLHGVNTYTLTSNFISWDAGHNYNLTNIAATFGTRREDAAVEVVGGAREVGFACGDGAISAFDFGLLYSVFTAMIAAKMELGVTVPIYCERLTQCGTSAVWFGNNAVVYSTQRNLIVPLKNVDVERVCSGERVSVRNFCNKEVFQLEREDLRFCLTTSAEELFNFMTIPQCVAKTYSRCFDGDSDRNRVVLPSAVEEGSALGDLIGATDTRSKCLEILEQYKLSSAVDSVVAREDLIVVPDVRYKDTSNFFGSICYTDKGEIAVAVNFRRGLFVYYSWFSTGGSTPEQDVKVDPSAKFPEFYNVTDGCNRIQRYAGTVVNRPLVASQFDTKVFDSIKTAFLNMKLTRIPIQAAFGKVVIPESVLLQELMAGTGETLYCFVPVGIVGTKLICLTAEDVLTSVTPNGWSLEDAFYDITEVAKNVKY